MERYCETGMLELNQTGFSDRIIESLRFYVGTKKIKWATTEAKPLVKCKYR